MRYSVLFLLCTGLVLGADANIEQILAALGRVTEFREAAISPDAKRVAWVESIPSADFHESSKSAIYVDELGPHPGKARRITAVEDGYATEHGIAWSPDSSEIAFLSDAGSPGQLQLYLAEGSGKGAAKKITSLTGFLSTPEWSPDGKRLAFLFTENAPRAAGPTEPMTPPSGAVDSKLYEQRIAIVDLEHRTLQQVSPEDLYVFEYEWSPDGGRFALTAAPAPGDDNWFIAQIYTMEANGGPVRSIWKTPMQMAMPRWSPDGKQIAVIAGLMSDEGSTGGEVYSIPAAGGTSTDLTPDRKSSPSSIHWIAQDRIVMTENAGGGTAITTLNPRTRETETIWRADESDHAGEGPISLASDGHTAAAVRGSWAQAPEVWAGPIGEWREITDKNKDSKRFWGAAKSIEWNSDGFHAQGWLLFPENYREGGKYPMVVSVHGGPAGVRKPAWPGRFFDLSVLAGKGYFVFFPNPRGSFGQGEAFTRANVKDFGGGDLRDILAGVDHVVNDYPVDPKRIGVAGWSYGGFMTMWAVTQTGRFRAAVAGAGIANWQSYYGENSIDQWMIPYFGASVYDDPAVYAKSSPIDFVKHVKTPTLMLVGDRDGECPAPQSFELWHALKTLGVKTGLVVYPDEGHHFKNPDHLVDVLERTVAWFDENMPE